MQYAYCCSCYDKLPERISTPSGVVDKFSLIIREYPCERDEEVGNDCCYLEISE